MQLALLKMTRGPDYAIPGPWADDPIPRETIFTALRHCRPIVGKTADHLPSLDCLVIGDKHGAVSSEWPSGSSLWEKCARGYRREADAVWVAENDQEEENDNSAVVLGTVNSCEVDNGRTVQNGQQGEVVVKASAQPGAACMLKQAISALEGEDLAPNFTWIDLPCSPSTTIDRDSGSTISWGSIADVSDENTCSNNKRIVSCWLALMLHVKQLLKVNAAAEALYEAAPKGTLLLLVCQDSLQEAIQMKEEKFKARYKHISFQCILIARALHLTTCYTLPCSGGHLKVLWKQKDSYVM